MTPSPLGASGSTVPAAELARIRFLCRRGMKELDVLLQGYLLRRFPSAGVTEQGLFLRLLDREDPEIWAWIVGYESPAAEFAGILDGIRSNR